MINHGCLNNELTQIQHIDEDYQQKINCSLTEHFWLSERVFFIFIIISERVVETSGLSSNRPENQQGPNSDQNDLQ